VALAVSADQVHGQIASHEHDSKYLPSSRHAMGPSPEASLPPLPYRLPCAVVSVKARVEPADPRLRGM
jgi:hypothetical protein